MEGGTVYVKFTADESEYNKGLKNVEKSTSITGSVVKGVVAGLGITKLISGAMSTISKTIDITGQIGKQALQSYAEYEQLVGGVETLFKDSADIVQEYANNAYKTAGLSANDYMSTVTSFSASLLQSLGGDTKASAEYANQAIIDMSDNANKMGTDMSLIQNAYQGFAKQNYTINYMSA